MVYCGVSTGLHKTHDNLIQLEYVKGLLEDGEMPSINLQVSEELPEELLNKFDQMGIDKNKIKICGDVKTPVKKAQTLLSS